MKCLIAIGLAACTILAADDSIFATGQAARAVIGQETFTSQLLTATQFILGGVGGVAYANNTLIVADSNRPQASPENNRVLIYFNINNKVPKPTDYLGYPPGVKCPVCLGTIPNGGADVVLGQPDFTTTDPTPNVLNNVYALPTPSGFRTPTAVATNGIVLAVADTDNNRVLIWNSMPTRNNQPADVVVGQANFNSYTVVDPPNAKTLRGPQGVWIQNGKLFIADTANQRVLIYNQIPTANGAAADVVLGQPNFNTHAEQDASKQATTAAANSLLDPVSVSSDGIRLFVSDLGNNRVLIWSTVPTTNDAPANVAIGQPDLVSTLADNVAGTYPDGTTMCASNGTDSTGALTYPSFCNTTLSFPRFVLGDGRRLFVADGGNDRVLVYNTIPTQNGVAADIILGQNPATNSDEASDAVDSLSDPISLAWDGLNLYVADPFNRRITVYSQAPANVPYQGVVNAASLEIFAIGDVTLGGTIQADDTIDVNINYCAAGTTPTTTTTDTTPSCTTPTGTTSTGLDYKVTVQANDTLNTIGKNLVNLINAGAGDPNVLASFDATTDVVTLTARNPGPNGNNITLTVTLSTNALITATASGANLTNGGNSAQVGPGSLVTVKGANLTDQTAVADTSAVLPTTLGNTQVFINGIASPLTYVSPTSINVQVPYEVFDTTSVNAYVRAVRNDGSVTVTSPVAVTIVPQNPGIFANSGTDPRPGIAFHSSSHAMVTVSVDGTIQAGDVATVTIEDRSYTYTVQSTDTLDTVRDALIGLINTDPKVTAVAATSFDRIRIFARVEGPEGNGIPVTTNVGASANIIITAIAPKTCCANIAGAPVDVNNPAVPGETIILYATGLGLPNLTDAIKPYLSTGVPYNGPPTEPQSFVSSIAGGETADVLGASLKTGTVGVYEVLLELGQSIPTDPVTQLYIAQDVYISNLVSIPVVNTIGSATTVTLPCPTTLTGTVGTALNIQLNAFGGVGPYTYTVIGTLPAGMTLVATTGQIYGTPTATGSFTVAVTDTNGTSAIESCTITVNSI